VRVAVTGSVATDYLMRYPGNFTDHLIGDRLDKVSLTFLVDDLEIRPGGVAANISFGLAQLGLSPLLIAAVGMDFVEHGARLARAGVNLDWLHVSATRHTARFLCTTDQHLNQMASFYPGAMTEARDIRLASIAQHTGGFDLVHIAPNDPAAMLEHTRVCREQGYRFVADPSQQLVRFNRDEVRSLITGADLLFTNEYERELLLEQSAWTADDVLRRVGHWITTLGESGARVESHACEPISTAAVPVLDVLDPTGAGDAFRAGFHAGLGAGTDPGKASRIGAAVAAAALEAPGPQDYRLDDTAVQTRLTDTYGVAAAESYAALRAAFSTHTEKMAEMP